MTAILFVAALVRGQQFAICVFVPSMLLGAAAAVNLPATGGIQPAHLLLATLVAMVARDRETLKRAGAVLRCPGPGFWLLCTLIYGLLGAAFIPRVAAMAVEVNAIGVGQYGVGFTQVPLGPTSGNITQSVYFIGDVLCFVAISVAVEQRSGFQAAAAALLAYCIGDIAMAVMDVVTSATNTAELLSVIRNANYTIFSQVDDASTKRIIGSFTEASSFATATLGVFAFSTRLWIGGVRPRLTLVLSLASLASLLFSTASTAYASLPFCILSLLWGCLPLAIKPRGRSNAHLFMIFVPLICAVGILAIALNETTFTNLSEFFDGAMFSKGASQSGMDRARFNAEAWQSFLDSAGVGLGIGSVRASSFALAVLANLGAFGATTYAGFIVTALWPSRPTADEGETDQVRAAARVACLGLLVAACVSGALIDLGLPFFVFAGLAGGRRAPAFGPRNPFAAAPAQGHAIGSRLVGGRGRFGGHHLRRS